MIKSRTLEADCGDGLYHSFSGGCGLSNPLVAQMCADPEFYFNLGYARSQSYRGIAPWMGEEYFESTTHPKPKFNSCLHRKTQSQMHAYLLGTTVKGRYFSYQDCTRATYPACALRTARALNWSEADNASRRAWNEMQPRFEGAVSTLNFLFELKDFKDIAKFLWNVKVGTVGTRLKRFWNRLPDRKVKNSAYSTLSDITSSAANIRLANEFALKPLISDIMLMAAQLEQQVLAVQEKFQEIGQTNSISHYSETLHQETNGKVAYGCLFGTHDTVIFTATMELKFEYELRNSWQALKRYWGLELTPEVIWNAIPFSFILDYFLKVGKLIHSMSRDRNVVLDMTQYCESLLSVSDSGICIYRGAPGYKIHYSPTATSVGGLTLVSGIKSEIYHRRVTRPNKGLALPRLTVPSTGQLLNGLALLRSFCKF